MSDRRDDELMDSALLNICSEGEVYLPSSGGSSKGIRASDLGELIDQWQRILDCDGEGRFARRLEWSGLTLADVSQQKCPKSKFCHQLPEWGKLLRELLSNLHTNSQSTTYDVPFKELIAPLVDSSTIRLDARLVALRADLEVSQDARFHFNELLARQLFSIAGRAFQYEFTIYRAIERQRVHHNAPNAEELYSKFVRQHLEDRLIILLTRYPVLARAIATTVGNWIKNTGDFISRAGKDRHVISGAFGKHERLIRCLTSVETELSDPHLGGQSVIIATFDKELKVVYKPKLIESIEVAAELIEALSRVTSLTEPLVVPKVLTCDGYGWCEYVISSPCTTSLECDEFFFRAGVFTAVVDLMQAEDFHHENIVAQGKHPVPVDLETFMCPRVSGWHSTEFTTILSTGMLPQWQIGGNGAFDLSAMGADFDQCDSTELHWRNVGSDEMSTHYEAAPRLRVFSRPRLGNEVQSLAAHVDSFCAGYSEMYDRIAGNIDAKVIVADALKSWKESVVRVVVRETRLYAMLRQRLFSPENLRSGLHQRIELEILFRAHLASPDGMKFLPIVESEIRSLQNFDIPIFFARAGTTDKISDGAQWITTKMYSGIERVHRRLASMSPTDRGAQVNLIRMTALAGEARATTSPQKEYHENVTVPRSDQQVHSILMENVKSIAAMLKAGGLKDLNGDTHWIGLDYDHASEKYLVQGTDLSLYRGVPGVALFLAAAWQVTRDEELRLLAHSGLRSVVRSINGGRDGYFALASMGLGGAWGLGSLIYSLVWLAQLLNSEDYLDCATVVANRITPERIISEIEMDAIGGVAGAILGLLMLHQKRPKGKALEKALLCGERLLQTAIRIGEGAMAWRSQLSELSLTGLSHGAAGISLALARLHDVTKDEKFLQAARSGFRYEANLFKKHGMWPDYRRNAHQLNSESRMSSWCTGATGIALSRLLYLTFHRDEEVQFELEAALNTALGDTLGEIDFVCCGNFGTIDVLYEAGRVLGRRQLIERARLTAVSALERRERHGAFMLAHQSYVPAGNPGFFRGISGIGYTLVRLLDHDLPCILGWAHGDQPRVLYGTAQS